MNYYTFPYIVRFFVVFSEFREKKTPRYVPTLDLCGFDIPPKVNRVTIKKVREIQKTRQVCHFCGMIIPSGEFIEVEKNKFSCAECFRHLKE
jgi:hypothetical protein